MYFQRFILWELFHINQKCLFLCYLKAFLAFVLKKSFIMYATIGHDVTTDFFLYVQWHIDYPELSQ